MSRKAIYWIGGGIILAGIGTYLYQQYKLSQKISFKFYGYKLLRFGVENTQIGVNMILTNDGELTVDLSKVNIDVYANGIHVSDISHLQEVTLQPNGKTTVPLRVTFSPKNVFGSVGKLITGSAIYNIEFQFKGWLTVRKFGLPVPIPINERLTVREMSGG